MQGLLGVEPTRDRTGDLLLANWADIVAVGRHWASMAEPTELSGGGGTRWWHLFSVRTWSLLGPKHFFLSPLNRSGEVPASGGMQERAGSRAGCRSSSRGRARSSDVSSVNRLFRRAAARGPRAGATWLRSRALERSGTGAIQWCGGRGTAARRSRDSTDPLPPAGRSAAPGQ